MEVSMPCKLHFNLIGIPQHVVQRGNNSETYFYAEEDCRRYRDDVKKSAEKYGCKVMLIVNYPVIILITLRYAS